MTSDQLTVLFSRDDDIFCEFDLIANKRSARPDLHAFLLLDELVPSNSDMIGSASHDEISLDVDFERLASVITEDQVVELKRCGVMGSDGYLTMFA